MSRAADLAKAAIARGDLIAAYDITVSAIAGGDSSTQVRHQQVLALARMGDVERASELFAAYGLDRSSHPHERAAGARLLKDRALALPPGQPRAASLRTAFDAYYSIYRESGDSFPGINAATLALLAGETERAKELAQALLAAPAIAAAENYYDAATKAEALLVLGREAEAAEALRAAVDHAPTDYGARSSTMRQLAMIAEHLGLDPAAEAELLRPVSPPRVAHFCGHMFAEDDAAEARVKTRIGAILHEEKIGFAYGSLACGGDLLFAEAALERGVELHVVLPFEEQDFIAQSVAPGGAGWLVRYRNCREAVASVTLASEMEYFGDPGQFGYASRVAMGMARLRARHLCGEAVQVAIWDGGASNGPAGTGADVAAWRDSGGRSCIVGPGDVDRALDRPDPRIRSDHERALAAILFTDFAGFSTLKETALPAFWGGVMRRVADVLDAHEQEVVCRNSWGDALYAVADSASAAAGIALELQDTLAAFDYATLGLDGGGGMRVGVHYGSAYRTTDHITGRTTFYGTEVSKAARIEPVTPPGAVFVTEPMAAILALEAGELFACRYVGRIPLAKKYGDYPMYRLSRAG